MHTRAALLASSLFLGASMTSAIAADIYAPSAGGLKDPVFQEQVILPEAAAFKEYAEWYIRADVGFGVFGDTSGSGDATNNLLGTNSQFPINDMDFDSFFSGSIGFGRYATPNVRLGVDLGHNGKSSGTFATTGTVADPELANLGNAPLSLSTTTLMFNAVYDFAPQRRFSPYVGGGIGWAFHNLKMGGTYTNNLDAILDPDVETGSVRSASNRSNSFAANVVTGVSVNLRQGLFLDVGYKFSYLGDADIGSSVVHPNMDGAGVPGERAINIELNDLMTHEFKVGLRYDLY